MPLISLPIDILDLIIDEIGDQQTLLQFNPTCKIIRAQVEPKLYDHITLKYWGTDSHFDTIRLLHESIVTRESPYASRVHSFTLIGSNQLRHEIRIVVDLIDEILKRLHNLKSLFVSLDFIWTHYPSPSIFFPCLKCSPPPFQLEQIVWDHTINMRPGFHDFLSKQHSVTDLTLLPLPDSTFDIPLPSTALPRLKTFSGAIDCLHMFPSNHITAFNMPVTLPSHFQYSPRGIPATTSLRAFSAPTIIDAMKILTQETETGGTPSVMPNLEFVEIRGSLFLESPRPGNQLITQLSRRPIQYLRLPSITAPASPLHPQLLFSQIATLECIDYIDESKSKAKLYPTHIIMNVDALLRDAASRLIPTVCSRWRRGATSAVCITLPPRRLDQWELDLRQTE